MTKIKTKLHVSHRPVPQQSFPKDYQTIQYAGRAPIPTKVGPPGLVTPIANAEEFHEQVLAFIEQVREQDGIIVAAVAIVTDPVILKALASCRTILMVDKDSPHLPTVRGYNQLVPGITRMEMPGKVFGNLRSKEEEDCGYIDGARVVGNFPFTNMKRRNETIPLLHWKVMVGLVPQGRTKPPIYLGGFSGTANLSSNSRASFEMVNYTHDVGLLEYYYRQLEWMWSLSEGLYNFNPGMDPQFEWEKKPIKQPSLPKCNCGSSTFALHWNQFAPGEYAQHVFRCVDCNKLRLVKPRK